MNSIVSSLIINFIIGVLAGTVTGLILLGRHLMMQRRQKRYQHFTSLYKMPVQRVMERVLAGESPVFHTYHLSHRPYIYQLMLAFASREEGDFYTAFDYLGFTDDLLSGEIEKDQEQTLKDLAIIRSPMSKDYLYMLLLDGDQVSADRAAHALTRLELDESDREIILPSLISLLLPEDRIMELLNQLQPSRELCLQLLEERHSERFVSILSNFLASHSASSYFGKCDFAPGLTESANTPVTGGTAGVSRPLPQHQTAEPGFRDDALCAG